MNINTAPHVKHPDNVRTMMADMLIALCPAVIWGIYVFGWRALTIIIISVIASVLSELVFGLIAKKAVTIGDLSAVVTGLLLALCMPVAVPLWVPAVGAVFAVIIVKCAFGGLGCNFINPALSAYVFLKLYFPALTGAYTAPFTPLSGTAVSVDVVSVATPLSQLKIGMLPTDTLFDMLIGNTAGSIGEVSVLLLLAGGIYLLVRGVISWHIPVTFIGITAVLTIAFPGNVSGINFMLSELFSGGLILGAIFMATDNVTSPVTSKGKLIYGVLCGALTVLLRYSGALTCGVAVSILIMNLLSGIIDRITMPRRFGGRESGANKAATVKNDAIQPDGTDNIKINN